MTQKIDDHLMASLEQVRPSSDQQWFPISKGKPKRRSNRAAAVVTPHTAPLHPILQPASSPTVKVNAPTKPKHLVKRLVVFVLPIAITLLFLGILVIFRLLNITFLPGDAQTACLLLCTVLITISFILLTLYDLGELRYRYIFSNNPQEATTKDIVLVAVGLIVWPIFVATINGLILLAFLGNDAMTGTLNGLTTLLLITGPVAMTLGFILLWVASIYRKTTSITYPPYVHEIIDLVWHRLK